LPLLKRSFYIKCHGDECLKLAELIRDKAPAVESMNITIEPSGLRIDMYGYKSDVRNAWIYIKRLVSAYKSAIVEKRGLREISINFLVEKIGRIFPPRLLEFVVKKKGHKARIEGDRIITDADLDEIIDMTKKIIEVLDEIRFSVRGTACKYFIVASALTANKSYQAIIEEGLRTHILGKDEDGRIILKKEWRSAVDQILKDLSSANNIKDNNYGL